MSGYASAHTQSPTQQATAGPSKTSAIQAQVNEVVGIMQQNIEKVMERGERLDTLQTKTEDLSQSANQFRRGATKVRKQMWWKNMKLKIIVFLIVVAILLAIILPLVLNKDNNSAQENKP